MTKRTGQIFYDKVVITNTKAGKYMSSRKKILFRLNNQIKNNQYIVGVAAGSGLTALNAAENGADMILALSSGVYRNLGVSSLGAYLPFANSNQLNWNTYQREIITRVKDIPVIFGLMATDPQIQLESYIGNLKQKGIVGINNYPTVGLIDGQFREYLEENDLGFDKEVEAIRIASQLDLLTVAFVFNAKQAQQMLSAGADIICLHLGLTTGGKLGAKQIMSLQTTNQFINDIFSNIKHPNFSRVIKMIYGGPVHSLNDTQFIYDSNIYLNGYIGGSVFERFPTEEALETNIESFKFPPKSNYLNILKDKHLTSKDYVTFIQEYIHEHYPEEISLNELSTIIHVSRSYLSNLFLKIIGKSFTNYLIDYRLSRAIEIMEKGNLALKEVATMVGYTNYSQFSKIFKKRYGKSPKTYYLQTKQQASKT
ncbi:MAG: phosphoenolpyruvate hydrolase family protein [Tetragenococcus koreensis]|nr:phosphoenolpyruvate hydrolase family protein [Tetragenococcus koreensis]